jgi:hephaestin
VAPGDEEGFEESNLMHSIDGYVYGNGPVPVMKVGQRVRWYTYTLGTEVDLHTPHWHGNTVLSMGMRTDMSHLLPGDMMVTDMTPDDTGTWLFHCHVNDHILAGMQTRYKVQ